MPYALFANSFTPPLTFILLRICTVRLLIHFSTDVHTPPHKPSSLTHPLLHWRTPSQIFFIHTFYDHKLLTQGCNAAAHLLFTHLISSLLTRGFTVCWWVGHNPVHALQNNTFEQPRPMPHSEMWFVYVTLAVTGSRGFIFRGMGMNPAWTIVWTWT